MIQPLINEVIEKLNQVINKNISRVEASDWAMIFILDDEMYIDNSNAWELLKLVGAVDLMDAPGEYLYSNNDFRQWIKDYS